HKPGSRAEETSVFETLSKSPDSAPHINIIQWLATVRCDTDQISLNKSACNSETYLSATGHSQVLEDYPALLSYATFELFTHARLAEGQGADPSPIINRLKEKKIWARWVTLREDVPQGIELLHYPVDQGLSSWISNISGEPKAVGWRTALLLEASLL